MTARANVSSSPAIERDSPSPLVSVIIPAYNSAVSLPRSIDSALAQGLGTAAEIIVVNDGSTDAVPEVAARYAGAIVYIEQQNQGQAAARNRGLAAARGKYVAFLDSDDYWLPRFLRACLEFLESHPDAAAVSTGQLIKLWGKEEKIRPQFLNDPSAASLHPIVLEKFFEFWSRHDHIRTGSTLIRRELIEAAGYQRADLWQCEDLEYWGYLATFGRWGFIPQVLFVSDGAAAAAAQGWTAKYRVRRRRCPTVEQWQSRLLPRISPQDFPFFRLVRGRVATMFAHSKILAGDDAAALDIVREYGGELARQWSSRLMMLGLKTGAPGWRAACGLLRLRERTKSFFMTFARRFSGIGGTERTDTSSG
ncbi:MAG TPA: glycosyltransferase family A protein [Planctomycetota bacterium]|nr:glycosyltransferase family A protein [Planctomycetota bacterium]